MLDSFVYRQNRVPEYQRLFQKHDGVRQWWKVRNSELSIMYLVIGQRYVGSLGILVTEIASEH